MTEPQVTVIFNHGHDSGPDSPKIQTLQPIAEDRGCDCQAIDYRDLRDEPVARAERLKRQLAAIDGSVVLVGSSMGGYVAMAAAEDQPVAGLFLIAPALFLEHRVAGGVTRERYQPRCDHVALIHGWRDEIIPWQNSMQFASEARAALHLLDADHRLQDKLNLIGSVFAAFLRAGAIGHEPEPGFAAATTRHA